LQSGCVVDGTNPVGKKTQGPLRGDCRIELTQATGRSVARIDKFPLAQFQLALIQALKIRPEHQNFTTNLKHLG
jgi:hypothetical protein